MTVSRYDVITYSLFLFCHKNAPVEVLAEADFVKQRFVGRAGEEAASTFDAVENVVGASLFYAAVLDQSREEIRFQPHGTCVHTFAAADAVALLSAYSLTFVDDEYA